MLATYLSLLLAAAPQGASPRDPLQRAGEKLLQSALEARAEIHTGIVDLRETWTLPGGGEIERQETNYFSEGKYRTDIHGHSEFEKTFTLRRLNPPDPLVVLVWDGHHVLRGKADLHLTRWSVRSTWETTFPFTNRRWLGVPLVPPPHADGLRSYRQIRVLSVSRHDGQYVVTFEPDRSSGERTLATESVARFTLDPARGWGIVAYKIEEKNGGYGWTLRGEATYAQYGDTWFPQWFRHEQLRDGQFDWAREYEVIDARFNEPLPEQTFAWQGMGIPRGAGILSQVQDVPHQIWNGSQALPWRQGLSSLRAEKLPARKP